MNRVLVACVGVLLIAVGALGSAVIKQSQRITALEQRLAAPSSVAIAVDPYAETTEAKRLRYERLYQSFKDGQAAGQYITERDAAEDRGSRSPRR